MSRATSEIVQYQMHSTGGPEVFTPRTVELTSPGPGEAHIRHTAIGVNFLDIYFRRGEFAPPALPWVNGFEAAGIVEDVGPGVEFERGQRVAYVLSPGSYAEARVIAADRLIPLPDDVSDVSAAAMLLKGMTAEFLLHRAHVVSPGDRVLVHAAAGGVGSMLSQWARALGAEVIGTVGSEHKAEAARRNGCHHVLTLNNGFPAQVMELTGGVDVAYDGVGADTFRRNFDCLREAGHNVLFGWASGAVPALDVNLLNASSHRVSSPSLGYYAGTPARRLLSASRVFDGRRRGWLTMPTAEYPLESVSWAHKDLEERRTTGAVVLLRDG